MFIAYQNKDFLFFRKPHGLPSAFGKEKSFLEHMAENDSDIYDAINLSIYQSLKKYIPQDYHPIENLESKIQNLIQTFGPKQEYGLLNRLDNDTAGFLYFAKDLSTFDKYRQLQAQNKVEKHYIAQVFGNIAESSLRGTKGRGNLTQLIIPYPIMHRGLEKMIAIQSPKDLIKGRGKEHHVQTFVELLEYIERRDENSSISENFHDVELIPKTLDAPISNEVKKLKTSKADRYDKKSDTSILLVTIHKGIRHQIRVHLASIGFPIIGDPLYGKAVPEEILHLWSIGFKIVN